MHRAILSGSWRPPVPTEDEYRKIVLRLRADAAAWIEDGHPLDNLAKATALLEIEAARAIEQLLQDNKKGDA